MQSLPGTNPSNHWPDKAEEFLERIVELDPLQFWLEPYDITGEF